MRGIDSYNRAEAHIIPIVPNIDLPALCSSKFKPGPPSDEAQILSERLNDVLAGYDSSTTVYAS